MQELPKRKVHFFLLNTCLSVVLSNKIRVLSYSYCAILHTESVWQCNCYTKHTIKVKQESNFQVVNSSNTKVISCTEMHVSLLACLFHSLTLGFFCMAVYYFSYLCKSENCTICYISSPSAELNTYTKISYLLKE